MYLNPAKSVIAKLGGPAAVAEITKRNISRVYRWMYPASRGGTGGRIPQAEAEKLLDYACRHGVELDAREFFTAPSTHPEEAGR